MNKFDSFKGKMLLWLRKNFLPGRSFLDFALLPWKILLVSLVVFLLSHLKLPPSSAFGL